MRTISLAIGLTIALPKIAQLIMRTMQSFHFLDNNSYKHDIYSILKAMIYIIRLLLNPVLLRSSIL
jgi:hypothetical protein